MIFVSFFVYIAIRDGVTLYVRVFSLDLWGRPVQALSARSPLTVLFGLLSHKTNTDLCMTAPPSSNLIGVAMAASNTWGLTCVVGLLGYGLVDGMWHSLLNVP